MIFLNCKSYHFTTFLKAAGAMGERMKAGTKETITKIVGSCMCGIYSEEGLTVHTDG